MNKNSIRPEVFFTPEHLNRIDADIQRAIDALPEQIPKIDVSDFAEDRRVLPPGTPFPGPWRNVRSPYVVEIMDNLSVGSPVEEVAWIKCSQIGATAASENFIAYIIAVAPGPILYCTAKEDLLRKWVNKRFDPLLKSCNLEDRIFKQNAIKGKRATGNQMFSKEFPGGALDLVSAQSESNLRMDSIRYLILDEAGAYPWNVQGFGDPIAIARARTANWGSRKKIFIPSTPGLEGECRMWDLFAAGDQRRYHVPCPFCGALMVLKFPSEPAAFYQHVPVSEIKWETRGGIVDKDSIHVICPGCKEAVSERYRYKMVQNGRWVPTAKSDDPKRRSYQIGRLYSLMDTWERLVNEEIRAVEDPLLLQTHHNHNCGIPYRETTQKPDIKKIYELRSNYKSGTIPNEQVLFLTASVDVQRGWAADKTKPPRLEMEVCGHGLGYRTWSISYKVFDGPVQDAYSGAWEQLYEFIKSDNFQFPRGDGLILAPSILFIDAGDGDNEVAVFDFCQRVPWTYPVKGAWELKKTEKGRKIDHILDERTHKDSDKWRENTKNGQKHIIIHTRRYKNDLWHGLKQRRQDTPVQRPRFCEFPKDYPDRYFDMLVAEERRADGSFWRPSSRPNEALDLRVYNMCAGEYWLWLEVQRMRAAARKGGQTKEQSEYLKTRHVLQYYEKKMRWRT